ncbi:hypothetical protein [Leeuwenhoekiella sp. ZYFB001]|uniref:hypothetical protein n=1 Tax=Leeuwenhoekiella sp. ZYFB001 TaxID=2719912 RepID=UPI00143209FF|nr:hypothetical protein [Leeuwenhoekiella sp. ZYFB001]
MSTAVAEVQVIDLDNLEANLLPELQGWREKQLAIVNDNPYVAIEDNSTYEEAKKARTALVTARTDVQKQEKTIASKLKAFRTKVSEASQELIDITLPHEEKQQDEVRRYEAIKEAEKAEKERIEQERKDKILSGIDAFYQSWKQKISQMTFNQRGDVGTGFETQAQEFSEKELEEFEMDFAEKKNLLEKQLDERVAFLTEQEEARVERERLAEERAAFEKQQAEARAQAEKEAKAKAEQEAKEREAREAAEAKAKAEREAAEDKLRKEREELEAEKKRIADAEAKRVAKIEAERKAAEEKAAAEKAEQEAKERAKAEAKRLEELKPSKEKAVAFIGKMEFPKSVPDFGKPEVNDLVQEFFNEVKEMQTEYLQRLNDLK